MHPKALQQKPFEQQELHVRPLRVERLAQLKAAKENSMALAVTRAGHPLELPMPMQHVVSDYSCDVQSPCARGKPYTNVHHM